MGLHFLCLLLGFFSFGWFVLYNFDVIVFQYYVLEASSSLIRKGVDLDVGVGGEQANGDPPLTIVCYAVGRTKKRSPSIRLASPPVEGSRVGLNRVIRTGKPCTCYSNQIAEPAPHLGRTAEHEHDSWPGPSPAAAPGEWALHLSWAAG